MMNTLQIRNTPTIKNSCLIKELTFLEFEILLQNNKITIRVPSELQNL